MPQVGSRHISNIQMSKIHIRYTSSTTHRSSNSVKRSARHSCYLLDMEPGTVAVMYSGLQKSLKLSVMHAKEILKSLTLRQLMLYICMYVCVYIYIYIYIYIYDISDLMVNDLTLILLTWRKWCANNASKQQIGFNSGFKGLTCIMLGTINMFPSLNLNMSSLMNTVNRKETRTGWKQQVKADTHNMVGERVVNSNEIGIYIAGYRKVQKVLSWKKQNG